MTQFKNPRWLPLGAALTLSWTASSFAMPPLPAPVFVDNGGVYTQGIPDLPVGNNGYTHPEDNPPPPGDAFNPPVSVNAPAAGAPAVSSFTANAGPDNTVIMLGGAFTTFTNSNAGSDSRVWSTDSNGTVYQPQILLVTNQVLAALMSPPSGNYGMYLTWAENANGPGYPVRVNGTDAWWIGPNHAVAGSSVSVYGRNLSYRTAPRPATCTSVRGVPTPTPSRPLAWCFRSTRIKSPSRCRAVSALAPTRCGFITGTAASTVGAAPSSSRWTPRPPISGTAWFATCLPTAPMATACITTRRPSRPRSISVRPATSRICPPAPT